MGRDAQMKEVNTREDEIAALKRQKGATPPIGEVTRNRVIAIRLDTSYYTVTWIIA